MEFLASFLFFYLVVTCVVAGLQYITRNHNYDHKTVWITSVSWFPLLVALAWKYFKNK